MYDSADRDEDAEKHQEPADPVIDVIEFHAPGPIIALTDLDGKGDDQDHRQNIQERDDHRVTGLRKPQEDRVQHQDHRDAEGADDDKVQFLVGEAVFDLIVPGQEVIVDPGDQHDDVIEKCFHLNTPLVLCKSWSASFCFT